MKTFAPLGLGALLLLSGCSSFMNGRFPAVGERFASLRHRNEGGYVVAEHVEKASPVQHLPAVETIAAGDCEGMPGRTVVVEDIPKSIHVEKVEERLLPEPAKPAVVHIIAKKHVGKERDTPTSIPSDVASEASEESAVGQMPIGRQTSGTDGPALQYLRNRRLRLDYEVRGAGPSGVSVVELWYTRDGKHWTRADTLAHQPPYVVDFGEEGRFGVTLVARNSVGVGPNAPAPGHKPQAWVEIDQTKPDVIMSEVKFNPATRVMRIAWSASDRNLDPRSVCLSYATEPDGPWSPIAQNVDNIGKYDWKVDMEEGQRVYIRVQVSDLAGNIGSAKTQEPVTVDMVKPSAFITKLEEAP
jgi:hypothetical protein